MRVSKRGRSDSVTSVVQRWSSMPNIPKPVSLAPKLSQPMNENVQKEALKDFDPIKQSPIEVFKHKFQAQRTRSLESLTSPRKESSAKWNPFMDSLNLDKPTPKENCMQQQIIFFMEREEVTAKLRSRIQQFKGLVKLDIHRLWSCKEISVATSLCMMEEFAQLGREYKEEDLLKLEASINLVTK